MLLFAVWVSFYVFSVSILYNIVESTFSGNLECVQCYVTRSVSEGAYRSGWLGWEYGSATKAFAAEQIGIPTLLALGTSIKDTRCLVPSVLLLVFLQVSTRGV